MSDEEKPLDLRDKLAIEILHGLLAKSKDEAVNYIIHHNDSTYQLYKDRAFEEADSLIQAAYFLADRMRKYRLVAFT